MAGLARGKIIVGDSSGNPVALALGTSGQVLKSDGTDLVFGTQTASPTALDDLTAGDAATTLRTTVGNLTLKTEANDTDIILEVDDAGTQVTGLKIDGSEAAQVQLPNDAQEIAFGNDQDVLLKHVADTGLTLSAGNNDTAFQIDSNNDDAGAAPKLILNRTSASPADNDVGGHIQFQMENDNNEQFQAGQIFTTATDVSDGTEDSNLQIKTILAGTATTGLTVTGEGIQTARLSGASDTTTSIETGSLNLRFNANGSECMRINSAPDLLVGTTTFGGNGFTFDTSASTLTHTRPSGSCLLYTSPSPRDAS